MRFLHRVFILAFLGFIFLLWWGHLLWRNQDNLSIMDKGVDLPPMFDMLLHIQQLRKKRLRSFCSKTGKNIRLPSTQNEASHLLSSITVNNKLQFLYCRTPATGVEDWEQLLEMLQEKENVTLQIPIAYHHQFGNQKALSLYNLTSMESMLKSYTKVIFIREPFQRLTSAYLHGLAGGLSFEEFIQNILDNSSEKNRAEWAPLVTQCHPCLIQYDYILMFGLLGNEVHHLILRTGLPKNIQIPEFIDAKVRWAYSWLEEHMFHELSLVQKQQLCHFYRLDFAAFRFPFSMLWDHTCTSGSN
uniref:Carbohydrate sulfotransferase n=1 Tax=Pogona vitticeps TaxID=103695 RepID=A0A6J0UWF9_9SAUR